MVTCLGRDLKIITDCLREAKHGFSQFPPFLKDPNIPVSVAGTIEDFETSSPDPEDWTFPSDLRFRLDQLRTLAPNSLYAHFAVQASLKDAGLDAEEISHPRTGLFTASSGSALLTHYHLDRLKKVGAARSSPMGIVASIAGTLNFNLAAAFKIKGASTGFVSACASSGHALLYAIEEIVSGRQDRMLVVGAEDFTLETILPFAAMRVLTLNADPETASRPFDQNRDGFVATGGAVCMILESEELARNRGIQPRAEFNGWGQATDGYHVAIAHPEGEGIRNAMEIALKQAGLRPSQIDYVNAHATSTPTGDIAEARAIASVFHTSCPPVSSTKGLTGHALSLSSIMEAAFCAISMEKCFFPGNPHLRETDPDLPPIQLPRETGFKKLTRVMTNSSGFGGANVALVMGRPGSQS